MTKELTAQDMDLTHCAECGCGGEMYIHSKCHMTAPVVAVLHHGLLRIECSECAKPICYFTIAGGPYQERPQ